jgi:hypothetical protein
MAQLFQLVDIKTVIDKYNLKYLIETGTGSGETLSYVKNIGFELIQSCEIEKAQFEKLSDVFNESNIKLWNGDSTTTLKLMLDNIDGPALIYLDAHFPGAGYVRNEFKSSLYSIDETLPLEKELKVISDWAHGKNSVVVVDDLRIYKPGNYEGGDWPEREVLFGKLDYTFLYNTLNQTHDVSETLSHQGGIIYTPKR